MDVRPKRPEDLYQPQGGSHARVHQAGNLRQRRQSLAGPHSRRRFWPHRSGLRGSLRKTDAFDQEYRIRRKDGAWIWVYDRATRTHEENGVILADGILSDITARKQAEAELQSQTAFLEAQTNSTIDGILVVNRDNQRLLLNQRMVELFNVPPEIAANKNDGLLLNHVVSLVKDQRAISG